VLLMIISGQTTRFQQVSAKLAPGFAGFVFLVWALGSLLYGSGLIGAATAASRQIAYFAFLPFAGILAIAAQFWFNRRTVEEFSCDETLFRFRTRWEAHAEVRDLSEIAAIHEQPGRSGPTGYRLVFRDGATAYMPYHMPNAKAMAEWSRSHGQGAWYDSWDRRVGSLSARKSGA